jgi:ubiquinone/menaquinone biosynthesis C-methylase UbiE
MTGTPPLPTPDRAAQPPRAPRRDVLFDPVAGWYGALVPVLWHVALRGVESWLVGATACAERVLDAGTGSGHWLGLVGRARERRALVGLDSSAAALRAARRRSRDPRALLVRADLLRTPFPDAAFDAVVCAWVLDTLVPAGAALAEFRRVLAPRGVVALVLRGRDRRVSAAAERLSRACVAVARAVHERSPRGARMPRELWRREPLLPELPALAAGAGFDVVHLRAGPFATRALLCAGR